MAYKLGKIDSLILYELDRNARISDNQLAKRVKRSREAVRQRIKKLQEDGIIQGFITAINPSKFGYAFFKLYFQLANIPYEREKLYAHLKKTEGIYWFGGSNGVWDLHGTFYAKEVEEFNNIKNKICHDFKHLIIKRDVGMLIKVRMWPKRFFLEKKSTEMIESVIFSGKIVYEEIDPFNKKILKILLENARTSIVEIARQVQSSVDIVRRRIRDMEEKGIIIQYRLAINHIKLGYEMFKVFIYFNQFDELLEKKLIAYVHEQPEIMYLINQLSAWEIELEMMMKSYEAFISLMQDFCLRFGDAIRNYEFVVMKEDIFMFK